MNVAFALEQIGTVRQERGILHMKSWADKRHLFSVFIHIIAIYMAIRIEESHVIGIFFMEQFILYDFLKILLPVTIMNAVLLIGICIIVKQQPLSLNPVNRIASAFFAFFMLMGHCFSSIGAFFPIFTIGLPAVLGICYFFGFYLIFRHILSFLESHIPKRSSGFFGKHIFLFSWIIMFVCWLPYVIIRYPAGIEWDAYHQIQQALGMEALSAHWPLGSTFLMGLWVKAGFMIFHSYEAGVLMFVLFQMIVSISILAYSLVFLRQLDVPPGWCKWILAVYSIVPFYPAFFTSVVKDSLFAIFVLLDIILIARKLLLHKKGGFISIMLTSTAMCLLRNNGIYIVLFWLAIMTVYSIMKKKQMMITLIGAMCVTVLIYSGYSKILLPYWNVGQTTARESLSMLFQQTARCLRDHPEEISTEEKEVIGKVLDINTIGDVYNPLLSDPVKATFHGSGMELMSYLKVWFRMFFEHPVTYADAALHTCYGFFYPDARQSGNKLPGLYRGTISEDTLILQEPEALWLWQEYLTNYVRFWEQCPFTFALYNVPIQMWAALWLGIYWINKKSMIDIILLMPAIAGILVCIASPTWWNNGFRYALPIICANPMMFALAGRDSRT